jgi:hypothetical protein
LRRLPLPFAAFAPVDTWHAAEPHRSNRLNRRKADSLSKAPSTTAYSTERSARIAEGVRVGRDPPRCCCADTLPGIVAWTPPLNPSQTCRL